MGISLLFALAIAALFTFSERDEVLFDRGFVGAARTNPLLAFERTCTALGTNVGEWSAELEFPAQGDAVLIQGTGSELGKQRVDVLLEWVAEGNVAVVLLPSDGPYRRMLEAEVEKGELRDPLLIALGLGLQEWDLPGLADRPFKLVLPNGASFELAMRHEFHLYSEGEQVLAFAPEDNEESTLAILVGHGLGQVAVFAESNWLGNGSIGDHDHAALAWALLEPQRPSGTLRVVRNASYPGLLAWLLGRGWPVTTAALVLLVVVLWRVTRRFGPPLPELPRDRRDFGEHLDAVGRLQWRLGATDELLAPMRVELRQHALRLRREWCTFDDARFAEALAEASGRPVLEVHTALNARTITTPQEFTRTVQCLRALQEAL